MRKGKFAMMTLFQVHFAAQMKAQVTSVKIIFSWDLVPSNMVGKHPIHCKNLPLQFSGSNPKVKTANFPLKL
jgi:hypothetical protein